MPFTYVEPTGYSVDVVSKNGEFTNVYKGGSRERAVSIANFWDERMDIRFIDYSLLPQDALSVAHRKLDALAEYIKTA